MTEDILSLAAGELTAAFRSGCLSPVEVTAAALTRIEDTEPDLNAFVLVARDEALAQAEASEARWRRGEPAGLLDGVPVSIKDLTAVAGWRTRKGSLTTEADGLDAEDASAVARLRSHGAVFIGKTTVPEFGWKPLCDSPLTGITRNPWRLDRTPSGSTGGGAVSVATGTSVIALGSDGGGSIRHPASFNGLVGLKPSFGRIPFHPRIGSNDLTHLGVITRSVSDAALALTVVAGRDARDGLSFPEPPRDFGYGLREGVRGLRIAYSRTLGYAEPAPEVGRIVDDAVHGFEALGAVVEPNDPFNRSPLPVYLALCRMNNKAGFQHLKEADLSLMDPGLVAFVRSADALTLDEFYGALTARVELTTALAGFFESFDLLVTPTMPTTAAYAEPRDDDLPNNNNFWSWIPYTFPFSLTKSPAVTVNCGFAQDGLPVGLQIVGPFGADALVLRAAQAFEQLGSATWSVRHLVERLPSTKGSSPRRALSSELSFSEQ
jgi:aspartyl-tRNA(Asn)/glutamyl-tRNA(Gln) amidotransferase subunit A